MIARQNLETMHGTEAKGVEEGNREEKQLYLDISD